MQTYFLNWTLGFIIHFVRNPADLTAEYQLLAPHSIPEGWCLLTSTRVSWRICAGVSCIERRQFHI